jgi:hypothetical protein
MRIPQQPFRSELKTEVEKTFADERTIRKIMKTPLTDQQRVLYQRFQWPESMINGLLEWAAARAALDLLAESWRRFWPPPTNEQARWFWRLTLAAPDLPIFQRVEFAFNLAAMDVSQMGVIVRKIESSIMHNGQTPEPRTFPRYN